MRKLIFISFIVLFISFFITEIAIAAHQVYKCPSSDAYQQHLISGKTLRLCPDAKKQCHHEVWMSSYLKKYGGYSPKSKWKVTSAHGYKNKQCRYSILVTKEDKSKQTLPGYMQIKMGGITNCNHDKDHANQFKCEVKNKTP